MAVKYDADALEEGIVRFFSEFFLKDIGPETPMDEVRERCDLVGTLAGRALGACMYEGKVETGLLMCIRSHEEEMRRRTARSASLYGPGGAIREAWNKQQE